MNSLCSATWWTVGPEPIKVLQDMMKRPNVIFILGNHDFVMYSLMKTLAVEITEDVACMDTRLVELLPAALGPAQR